MTRAREPAPVTTPVAADALAAAAHAGQFDRAGAPYVDHVRAVADGLAPFGPELRMAGLLHDVVEDTDWTADGLRAACVPERVVRVVERVTRTPGTPYEEEIRRVAADREATLVKISDNAHNSRADRAARLPAEQRTRLAARYRAAREVLWHAVDAADVVTVVSRVNPDLLRDPAALPAGWAPDPA